ncbi:antitoxin [Streptomyces sp. Ru87]|uniref:antitoxin n=1 Tax=Streptomyces sp. Ru87 TaxID=2044307 RepID=UPI000BF7FC60|nr:antitoxin [Streptomyces sp. Ru87]PGH52455.1 hypothetical protein CRI70_01400 [Streptomyces sp. Ru87]
MGMMDKLKAKMKGQEGRDLARRHGEKMDRGVDRAGDTADERTQGKYSKHIDTGTEKGKDALGRYSGRDEGTGT